MKTLFTSSTLFCMTLGSVAQTGQEKNNALYFDGINDYVNLNNLVPALAASPSITIEFWMKADYTQNTSSVRTNFFALNPPASTTAYENKFSLVMGGPGTVQTGQLIAYDLHASPPGFYTSTQVIGDNTCHHIAYVRTPSVCEVFIDGVSIGTRSVGLPVTTSDRASLGQEWDYGVPTDFYKGYMDELRFWNYARTQTQIQADMYHPLTGSEPGLIAYYNFNQGTAGGINTGITTLIDVVGGHHGTLVNFGLSGTISNWVDSPCASFITGETEMAATENTFTVYPNPAGNSISLTGNALTQGTLSIINMQGQIIMQGPFMANMQLDVSAYPEGVYTITLTNSQSVASQRLVIAH